MRIARRTRHPRDAGLTLIELAVAMLVGSILMGAIGTVFVGTLRSARTLNSKTSSGADARIATEAMSRALKVATAPYGEAAALVSASTTGMSFYALLNRTGSQSSLEPIPTLMAYSYASGCLYEYQTPGSLISAPAVGGPYFSWPASARIRKCLLRTTSAPSFSYFSTGLTTATALPASTGLSTSDLALVRSIQVNLVATDPANPAVDGVPTQTRISLENLINADGS